MKKAENFVFNLKDLEEAIYYLPDNFEISVLCKALKAVYLDSGKENAEIWFMNAKNNLSPSFDALRDEACLRSYQEAKFQEILNNMIFKVIKEARWIPKPLKEDNFHKKLDKSDSINKYMITGLIHR